MVIKEIYIKERQTDVLTYKSIAVKEILKVYIKVQLGLVLVLLEKLSFGGQEMSGNVGKYGETQAQICPYSQQTLKV